MGNEIEIMQGDVANLKRVMEEIRKTPLPKDPKEFLALVIDETTNPILGNLFTYPTEEQKSDRTRLVRVEDVIAELYRQQDAVKIQVIKGKAQLLFDRVQRLIDAAENAALDVVGALLPIVGLYERALSISAYFDTAVKIENQCKISIRRLRRLALPQRDGRRRRSKLVSTRRTKK